MARTNQFDPTTSGCPPVPVRRSNCNARGGGTSPDRTRAVSSRPFSGGDNNSFNENTLLCKAPPKNIPTLQLITGAQAAGAKGGGGTSPTCTHAVSSRPFSGGKKDSFDDDPLLCKAPPENILTLQLNTGAQAVVKLSLSGEDNETLLVDFLVRKWNATRRHMQERRQLLSS